jgi:arginine repressor
MSKEQPSSMKYSCQKVRATSITDKVVHSHILAQSYKKVKHNGKMRLVETIPGIGERGNKGE